MKRTCCTNWASTRTPSRSSRRTKVGARKDLTQGLRFQLLKCQCFGKMEQFKKAIDVVLEMDEDLVREAKSIGFDEELHTNFVAQICYFLLSRKEYQKRELLVDLSVRT